MIDKSVIPKIIMINIIVFLLWSFYGLQNPGFMINNFLVSSTAVVHGRIWTLLTSVFSHNMLWHLFINMFVLFNFGVVIENYLGSKRFLKFYLMAGLAGSFGHCIVSAFILQEPSIAALGASGAISGVVLFFALLYPQVKIYLLGLIPLPAIWAAFLFVALDAIGLVGQTRGGATLIGHGAHLGGALAGAIYYMTLHHASRHMKHH